MHVEDDRALSRRDVPAAPADARRRGRHDARRAARLADEAFGGWTGATDDGSRARRGRGHRARRASAPRLAIVPREGAAQSELRIGHLSARRDTPDYSALLVMNAVLGGQFVSRINLKLREEKGYTYGARTGFDWRRGLAPFSLQASVHTAATADAIRDSLNELDAIRGARPATDERAGAGQGVADARLPAQLRDGAAGGARRGAARALRPARHVFRGVRPAHQRGHGRRRHAGRRQYLDPARLTTLVVGDHAAIDASLRGLGLGEPQLLPSNPVQIDVNCACPAAVQGIRAPGGSSLIPNADPDADGRVSRAASVAVLIGVLAAVVAGATIWLLLTDPVTVANAVDEGEISPLVRQLAQVIYNALAGLLDLL